MVDSISVIGPGWRATDTSNALITDGILEFYDAGTSNARTVYSDSALSSSLGTTVDCNSGGYPVTSGNARTLIYTGNTAYKVVLTSATVGGTVWSHDNVLGALDTSSFLTDAAVADQSVVATSSNRSVTTADKGKLINVNCTGGDVTITLADAATLGDGFFVGIRHDGTANQVIITGDGTDTFGISGVNTIRFALTGRGHSIWITCDATNFKCHSETPPLIGGTVGTIVIADRLSTPPGSPQAGGRYIVGSSPTGDWSGFSQHDIAEADGAGNWFNYTPGTDAGWVAYVQDENRFYSFQGSAWAIGVEPSASDTVEGLIEVAVQSEMEAGSSTTLGVSPGRQHFHPGHPKAGGELDGTGTPSFASGDYGMGSITDNGTGDYTLNFDTSFSSANFWCAVCGVESANPGVMTNGTKSTSSVQVTTRNSTNATAHDRDGNGFAAWGDYA